MGAWGTGFFENDDAVDWISDLEQEGVDAIEAALNVDDDDADASQGAQALAAAAVVLAMAGTSLKDMPEEVEAWLEEHGSRPEASLLERAHAAVAAVHESSELREQWEESDDFDAWDRLVGRLSSRLEAKVG